MSRDQPYKVPVRGASASKARTLDLGRAWWGHHRDSARSSLWRLLQVPIPTLMTALMVAIALALPATLLTALENLHRLGNQWDSSPKLSVYLNIRVRDEAIEALLVGLRANPSVKNVEYISAQQALVEFQAQSGFGAALGVLDENPLPPTLIITPTTAALEPAQLEQLVQSLSSEAIVDEVEMDMAWVRRLKALMAVGENMVLGLAALLSLGVLLAIGNTIRLTIENRREEIVVVKLVGGTNGFVRRPFLYTGAWYGAMGGLLACILVSLAFYFIGGSVRQLALSYQSHFELRGLGLAGCGSLLLLSTSLGLLGAWLAVSRHLSDIEPR